MKFTENHENTRFLQNATDFKRPQFYDFLELEKLSICLMRCWITLLTHLGGPNGYEGLYIAAKIEVARFAPKFDFS